MPYFRKHQTLGLPEKTLDDPKFMPCAAADKYYRTNGPIYTSSNDFYMLLKEDFVKAAYNMGENENALVSAWGGIYFGFYSSLSAVNWTKDIGNRSYAATGYLKPNLERPNM